MDFLTFFIEFRAHTTFLGPYLSIVDKVVLRHCCKSLRDSIKVNEGGRPVIHWTLKNKHYNLTKWLIEGGFKYGSVFWYGSPFQRVDDCAEFMAQTYLIEKYVSPGNIMNYIVDSENIKLLEWAIKSNYGLFCGLTDAFISGEDLIILQNAENGEVLRHTFRVYEYGPTILYQTLKIMGWHCGTKNK